MSSKFVAQYILNETWAERSLMIYGQFISVWVDGHGLGRNKIKRLAKSKFGKEVCGWISWNRHTL